MIFATKLFDYQERAVEKLRKIKVGALYMEQGTGKTRTTLELASIRLEKGKIDTVLWLCPCSVKRNLREDIEYHLDGDVPPYIIIRGIESLSSSDRLYLELLELVQARNCLLVVDESNTVKNFFATRTKRIVELSSHCKYKLILNGTPVSRTEADMFAQWYILDWRILGYKSYYTFAANHLEYREVNTSHGRVQTRQIERVLHIPYITEKISPYSYQITKAECLRLPRKIYHDIDFEMTETQKKIYKAVKEVFLLSVDELHDYTIYKLFSALQHVTSGNDVLSGPDDKMRVSPLFSNPFSNPRIQALSDIIERNIMSEKCIIYAKYKSEISIISNLLDSMGLSWVFFTGDVSQRRRQENRKAFRKDVQFLLTNKSCGAYGLNLQFCRNVIFYDNDFDLATRFQSEDRVHRIGQEQEVHIYDIYCPNTIDWFIVKCLRRKERMVDAFRREIQKRKENEDGVFSWLSIEPGKETCPA